jgi:hypothetical protein
LHYKYKISYDETWVAKQKVIEHLSGSYKEFFKKLSRLLLAINESNPGTSVDWTHK